MKRWFSATAITMASALATPASANLLVNGDFESTTAGTLFPNASYTAGSGVTGWLDQFTWGTVSGTGVDHTNAGELAAPPSPTGDRWARQWAGANTNIGTMLMQGFNATSLLAGTVITLSFNYVTNDAQVARYVVYGLDIGETFSQFPPNPCTGCTLLSGSVTSNNLLADSNTWRTFTTTFTLPTQYTAIAFGVYFGGDTRATPAYVAGIDNASMTVPLPGTLALLGLGLTGAALMGRRARQ